MGQSIAVIIIVIFLAFMFVPMAFLSNNQYEVGEIKQSLNLSAKALIEAVEVDWENTNGIGEGYNRGRQQEIIVDEDKLLAEFYEVLYKNYYNEKYFEKLKERLVLKVLVVNNRFYVANEKDQWSHPYFFTVMAGGTEIYLDIRDDILYYYDETGDIVYDTLQSYGMDKVEKDQIIIDSINQVVARETQLPMKGGLEIMIQSPSKHFNFLEGITFFVIYREDSELKVNDKLMEYRNYNVVGYTLGF